MNIKANWLLRFTSTPVRHCLEGSVNHPSENRSVTGGRDSWLNAWGFSRQWISVTLRTAVRRMDAAFTVVTENSALRHSTGLVRAWWQQRRRALAHCRQHIAAVVWIAAQRFDLALRVSTEEQIRAWWRVHHAERRTYWHRRGYADAQFGTEGYPHHGECACVCCAAYWSGYEEYGRGGQPAAEKASLLGLLSPPPREELFLRVTRHEAFQSQRGVSLPTRSNILTPGVDDHSVDPHLTPALEVPGATETSIARSGPQAGIPDAQGGRVESTLVRASCRWATRCVIVQRRM